MRISSKCLSCFFQECAFLCREKEKKSLNRTLSIKERGAPDGAPRPLIWMFFSLLHCRGQNLP